ncbi:zf-HC2 domain-containing protein [Saccharomonospora sp.]|uniref:anti-sigma factor family protein n=1 Tax=Saccharomonospora sp. TaxID=33913 RepID=UPI00261B8DC2|nr:zf-HC2 domain-containing protein [Saccharomonospora sp.]
MTVGKGRGLPESHLLPDAVVAFVDQELSLGAQERAAAHLAHCPRCSAEVAAQRAASTAVRQAQTPSISAGFLASLQRIPQTADLPPGPDNLAIGPDGQIVAVQRPDQVAGLRDSLPSGALGTSAPLGTSPTVLGNGPRLGGVRKRATQGAGVVVSGLVLSALALVVTTNVTEDGTRDTDVDSSATPRTDVLPAKFGGHGGHDTAQANGAGTETPGPSGSSQPSVSSSSSMSSSSSVSSTSSSPSRTSEPTDPSERFGVAGTKVTSTEPSISVTVSASPESSSADVAAPATAGAVTGAVTTPVGAPR